MKQHKHGRSLFTAVVGFPHRALVRTVNISVDATATGTAIDRVWPFQGFDEVKYLTTAEGVVRSSLAVAGRERRRSKENG